MVGGTEHTTEDLARAMVLLAEVREYLMRLPVVPATREVCRNIDAYLATPGLARVKEDSGRSLRDRTRLTGEAHTVMGACVLCAELFERRLTLKSANLDVPGGGSTQLFLRLLQQGVSLELRGRDTGWP